MRQLAKISEKKSIKTKAGKIQYQEFYPAKSKPKVDEIDRVLGLHYQFNTEELDFVLNYDVKYRLGRAAEDEESE
jgi:hypothetical protein